MKVVDASVEWFSRFAETPANGGIAATATGMIITFAALIALFFGNKRLSALWVLVGIITTLVGFSIENNTDWINRYTIVGASLLAATLATVPVVATRRPFVIFATIGAMALGTALAQVGRNTWPHSGWESLVAVMWMAFAMSALLGMIKLIVIGIRQWRTK